MIPTICRHCHVPHWLKSLVQTSSGLFIPGVSSRRHMAFSVRTLAVLGCSRESHCWCNSSPYWIRTHTRAKIRIDPKIHVLSCFEPQNSYFWQNSHYQSRIFDRIHNFKIAFLTKFTFWKSNFSQNSHFPKSHFWQKSQFQNRIFDKIHSLKIAFFTKITISKSHFSQNSQFQNLIFRKCHIFQTSNSW